MLKSFEEIEQAIEMMYQEKDASQRTLSRHLIKNQFRLALDKIVSLERTNKILRSDLEKFPEYKQQQVLKSLTSYLNLNPLNESILDLYQRPINQPKELKS